MKKIKYLFRCIKRLDVKNMFVIIDNVSIQFTQDWREKLLDAKAAVCAIKNYEEWELRVIADGINSIHKASWEQLVCQIKAIFIIDAKNHYFFI